MGIRYLFRITGRNGGGVETPDLWGDISTQDDRERFFGFITHNPIHSGKRVRWRCSDILQAW